jgi:hypothetical protein
MIPAHALVNALVQKGIHFLADYEPGSHTTETYSNAEILAGLASQKDARLRLALIPAFLSSQELASHSAEAIEISDKSGRFTLKVYYTAAFLLSKIYADDFHAAGKATDHLEDRFSNELNLSGATNKERLKEVAALYETATGLKANWLGTFHYAADRVIRRSLKELEWAKN